MPASANILCFFCNQGLLVQYRTVGKSNSCKRHGRRTSSGTAITHQVITVRQHLCAYKTQAQLLAWISRYTEMYLYRRVAVVHSTRVPELYLLQDRVQDSRTPGVYQKGDGIALSHHFRLFPNMTWMRPICQAMEQPLELLEPLESLSPCSGYDWNSQVELCLLGLRHLCHASLLSSRHPVPIQ